MPPHSTDTSVSTRDEQRRESPSLGMRLYATIWWSSFAVFTAFMFFMVVMILPTMIFDRRRRILHVVTTCFWGWAVYAFNPFWSLKVEGRNKLPFTERAVLVANHDSLADILVCGALFRPFKFVSKESVFKVPFLGWGMTLNEYIPLRRGDKESIRKMYERSLGWLEREVPVLLYPEGTRSPDGQVQQFKDGAFKLAIEAQAPIYPVVLAGTRDALPKHGLIAPLESHVRVKVLDPVYPEEFHNNLEALREHVRTVIIAEKARQTELLHKEHPTWALTQQ